ncbi:uncharacterized protein LOC118199301 [Stegodyphus dumicola]|uniref:uncharacterized protein LOC118199301 n=1 Tax=Stegodyphus dumicola TaxID=202533 RepID=UPI0015ADC40E|nr:uncharacterized protein LOC118199301 [Stegodyphus dumicola]
MSKFRDLLRQARTEFGDVDINLLLSDNVNDPVPLQDFNISSPGYMIDLFGVFIDVNLYGLKNFRVNKIALNLAKMNLSAEMSVPLLSLMGQYRLSGSFFFMTASGEGPFWMNMSSIVLRAHAPIETTQEGKLGVGDIKLDSDVGELNVNFENLMGGDKASSIYNSLLNMMGELILDELKPSLLSELSSYLKYELNNALLEIPSGFMDPSSTNVVDSILKKSAEFMGQNDLEPFRLPQYKEVYERNILFVTTRGELKLFNGTLHGLSTLSRKGDVITALANSSLVFEAEFEFKNLTGGYTWHAELLGAGMQGQVMIQVKSVHGFVKLKQEMKVGRKLELDDLHVHAIRHVWLDLQGLGTWDYVMESIVNLVTNGLKLQLADALVEPVKQSIQEQLDQLDIGI